MEDNIFTGLEIRLHISLGAMSWLTIPDSRAKTKVLSSVFFHPVHQQVLLGSLPSPPCPPPFLTWSIDAQAFSSGLPVSTLASLLFVLHIEATMAFKNVGQTTPLLCTSPPGSLYLTQKKKIHIPFHGLWALPFGPLGLAFLTSSPLSALLCSGRASSLAVS